MIQNWLRARTRIALVAFVALPVVLTLWAPALAADVKVRPSVAASEMALPFARSERAQSVWASGACWTECGSYCAWGQTSCLYRDTQGQCLKLTDDCDRSCQRACRTSGGPWLPVDF